MSSQGHLGAMEESGAGKQRDQICFRRIPLALVLEGELKGWRGQEPREGTAQAGEKGPTPGGGLHKAGNCLMRGRGRRQSRSRREGGWGLGLRPFPSGQGSTWLSGKVEADSVPCPLVATVSLTGKGPKLTHPGEGTSGQDAQRPPWGLQCPEPEEQGCRTPHSLARCPERASPI